MAVNQKPEKGSGVFSQDCRTRVPPCVHRVARHGGGSTSRGLTVAFDSRDVDRMTTLCSSMPPDFAPDHAALRYVRWFPSFETLPSGALLAESRTLIEAIL